MPTNYPIPEQVPDRLGKQFWIFLHSLLRHGDADSARVAGTISWFWQHSGEIQALASEAQFEIFIAFSRVLKLGGVAPSWTVLKEELGSSEAVADFVREYEDLQESLPLLEAADLPLYFQKWKDSRTKRKAREAVAFAQEICSGKVQVEDHNGRKLTLSGVRDALDMVAEVRHELFQANGISSTLVEMGDYRSRDIIREASNPDARRAVPTGIPEVDGVLVMSPGQLVGVLGGAGAGKSTLARSMAYNMATLGFRVLWVQLETAEEAEVLNFALIHAYQCERWGAVAQAHALNFSKLNRGLATHEATTWLNEVVLEDMEKILLGSISVLSPNSNRWDKIQEEIEALEGERPFDVVVIDYLTLCEAGSARDKDSRVLQAITDAARWVQGSARLMISPVQGRRDAAAKAIEEAEGLWDLSGIYKYSDYDRHLTACLSLSAMPDEAIHIGLPKNRWGAGLFRPVVARVDRRCGYITTTSAQMVEMNDQELRDLLEDI